MFAGTLHPTKVASFREVGKTRAHRYANFMMIHFVCNVARPASQGLDTRQAGQESLAGGPNPRRLMDMSAQRNQSMRKFPSKVEGRQSVLVSINSEGET
jgi:hypothetical protein